MFAYGETVTRQRADGVDDVYSDEDTELSWDSPDELDISGVAVAPGATAETADADRARLDIQFTLFMPYGADVKPLDRIVVRGTAYEVEGKPAEWRNPFTGAEAGTVVEVRRVAG